MSDFKWVKLAIGGAILLQVTVVGTGLYLAYRLVSWLVTK